MSLIRLFFMGGLGSIQVLSGLGRFNCNAGRPKQYFFNIVEEALKQCNVGKAQKGASQGPTLEFLGHWRIWWVAVAWINP
jgi:hypothetical protein